MPPLIPMDATTVHLDGNNMSELGNPGFIGRRRITTVFLNSSQIRVVTNYSLEGLTEVRNTLVMFIFWSSGQIFIRCRKYFSDKRLFSAEDSSP